MRQRLKISLSLLISLLLCGGFAVFSFTRLFNVVETTFFQPRIVAAREFQLEKIAERVTRYHRDSIARFQPVVEESFVPATFQESNQEAQQVIFDRQNYFGKLFDDLPNIQLVRFLGSEGKKIHFSTRDSDIESQDRQRIKYLDYDRINENLDAQLLLTPAGEAPGMIIDGTVQGDEGEQRFIYSFPVVDSGNYRGVVLFYVSKRDLLEYLLRFPGLDVTDLFLVGQEGIVFNTPSRDIVSIQSELKGIWEQVESRGEVYQAPVAIEALSEAGEQPESRRENYNVLSIGTDGFGILSLLIPYSVFQLQPIMKGVVIAAIFLTVFLVVYLILNLRQDPVLVLSQRIKRLQLDILREFVEGGERIDWKQWQRKLEDNRGELKTRIKRGIGRIPSQKEAELDGMIDRSWDEILSIIEARVGGPKPEAPDIRHIEELLQRALEGAQLTVQAPVSATTQAPVRKAGIVVEEIGVDEVVEPGEVIPTEEPEELEEAEAVEEVEEAAEAEELEEAEAVEEPEELEEAEAVEEAEEAAEAEELEEAEAVEEPEELEEAEAVEEAEELEEAEAEEAAEAEELEEAEAVEEPEELEEAEAVEEAEEAAEAEELEEAEAVEEPEEVEEAEAVEEAEELEEAEALEEAEEPVFLEGEEQEIVEELEGVKEIVPLPPLPQEQLEELPTAEAEQRQVSPLPGQAASKQPQVAAVETAAGPEGSVEELEVAEDETAPIVSILGAGEELVMEAVPGQEQAKQLSPEEIERIQRSDERKQLEELLASKTIRTYSLEDIESIIMEQRSSVVMENGVYRIKDEIVAGAESKARRSGLMALAEASLMEPAKVSGALESGIGALLGDESILDLETEIGQIRERSTEIEYTSLKKTKNIHFFEDGLDYDEYLKGFRGGKTETDRLRSLVEFSGKLKAVNAAIFSKENGKYSLVLKVGLNDPGFEVYFTAEEPFVDMLIKPRHTVYIGESIEKIKALSIKMHPEDLRYMQAALIFPAVFRGHESFLLLGLPVQWDLDIEDIITRLDIY
jgi:hypothetical protein